jgi:elongation factor G
MNDSAPRRLRDIGILAHIDAGKTSLTERILYVSGRIRVAGDIDDGTTATDFLDVEREHGITVKAAAANLEWLRGVGGVGGGGGEGSVRINLIDTPGHVDFSSEVRRSLRALDGAIVLICAVAGVQSRTEAIYRACVRRGAARLVFVNKMDRRGASFERAFGDLSRVLDAGAVAIQLPWGEGEDFHGVLDLIEMRAYDFSSSSVPGFGDAGPIHSEFRGTELAASCPEPQMIPPQLLADATRARAVLVEALAERDTIILEDFVAGRDSPPERLRAVLRAEVVAGRLTPVLCGSAFTDGAAALLLDAVADYLPAPAEAVRPAGTELGSGLSLVLGPNDPFSALVFKTAADTRFGRLSWVRVRSGRLAVGDRALDAGAGKTVRISKIFSIQADRLEETAFAEDGDIVALAFGGHDAGAGSFGAAGGTGSAGSTGATLCAPSRPLLYEPIVFEEPVVSIALEPKTREDGERLRKGAAALADEDPSLRLREEAQTGRMELLGMGELHLDVAVERLARDWGARVRVGKPRVAYRERLLGSAVAVEDFDRDLGGERARASVELRLEPSEGGFRFEAEAALRASPSMLEAARRGAEASLSVGSSAGFPLESACVKLERVVIPGGQSSNPGKSALRAVEIAASLAAGKALREAGTRVVEPVMSLEISVPETFLGVAAAAVTGRGGRIESIDSGPEDLRIISGAAPLRRLFGFADELRSGTEGRAECSTRFSRFEPLPPGFTEPD